MFQEKKRLVELFSTEESTINKLNTHRASIQIMSIIIIWLFFEIVARNRARVREARLYTPNSQCRDSTLHWNTVSHENVKESRAKYENLK